jgi:hypothetical protein
MKENITAYVILIKKGKMTLEQVPEEFREEVQKEVE